MRTGVFAAFSGGKIFSGFPGFSAPTQRGARTAAGVFALSRRLLFCTGKPGCVNCRRRVRPDGAALFPAPESRGTRTALACSPLTGGSFSAPADRGARTALACSPFPGGEFSAEPQRGIRRLRTAGASRRPPRGQKGRDTCGFPSSLNSYLSLAS